MEGTPTSPVTNAAARAAEPSEPTEGVRAEEAEETESGTTDEVIELDVSNEASPAHTASPPSESARAVASDGLKSNGGHPRDRLLASSSTASPINLPAGEAKRRNRWVSSLPAVSTAPPEGVDPDSRSSNSPTSPADPEGRGYNRGSCPPTSSRPKLRGPLAVKSKAAKPAADRQGRAPEQGLIEAIHSRLHTPPAPATGLLSIAAARPLTKGATNPQMPATPTQDPSTHTSTKQDAPTM